MTNPMTGRHASMHLCDRKLDGATKPEHIVLSTLGGKEDNDTCGLLHLQRLMRSPITSRALPLSFNFRKHVSFWRICAMRIVGLNAFFPAQSQSSN